MMIHNVPEPVAATPANPGRHGWLAFAAFLLAVAVAVWPRLPEVVPADAAPTEVSGGRAMALLERLAAAPRAAGSIALADARAAIVAELAAMGLAPEEQRGVFGRRLVNVVAGVAGTDPTGTVLLMAHYDSVPDCPGAGDDGVGVVSWLEAMRALRARGWQPRNDVLLLLTDGEEDGLFGAHLFARKDPRVAKVKVVVNLEAIGNGGPAYLFELGPRNGGRVELFAEAVARPAGSSFAEAVYHALPNDTDLSVFLKRGTQGFNLALTRGSCAYHAPHDTPANIDARSVQHMASAAAALAHRLGDCDLAALPADDVSFFDAPIVGVVAWPRRWDPWLAGLAVLVALAIARRERVGARALAMACIRHLLGVIGLLAAVLTAVWLADAAVARAMPAPSWVAGNTTSAALLFLGATALAARLSLPSRHATAGQLAARRAVAVALWSVGGAAACVWLPGTAFAFSGPALVIGSSALLPARWRDTSAAVVAPAALCALVDLPLLHLLAQLLAKEPLVALGLVTVTIASAARLLTSSLHTIASAPGPRRCLCGLAVVAMAAAVVVALGLGWRGGALWR